ncbi:hypothetical protein [Georgenia subflava]|uniref:Phosphodiesterase n=1 Tax=Georgenia subflava TaxID=1622177 RepID=A0A6N7EFT7_9MICO|nr:hypothetical protein [Georgenia subflava]MPV36989.1 hypothetical protein [Georgenia subflava]
MPETSTTTSEPRAAVRTRASQLDAPMVRAAGAAAAAAGGVVLGVVVAGIAVLRRAKPLHPRGAVVRATVHLHSRPPELGIALGTPGRRDAVVRFSRAVGLPAGWPDIQGLAIRLPRDEGPVDVLLASTGRGPLSRYVLTPRRTPHDGACSTLMPYRGPRGPVLIGAEPSDDPRIFVLEWATLRGPWRTFATLECATAQAAGTDAAIRFDPVEHHPDGLVSYPWAARLRRHAYRWARSLAPALPRSAGTRHVIRGAGQSPSPARSSRWSARR